MPDKNVADSCGLPSSRGLRERERGGFARTTHQQRATNPSLTQTAQWPHSRPATGRADRSSGAAASVHLLQSAIVDHIGVHKRSQPRSTRGPSRGRRLVTRSPLDFARNSISGDSAASSTPTPMTRTAAAPIQWKNDSDTLDMVPAFSEERTCDAKHPGLAG